MVKQGTSVEERILTAAKALFAKKGHRETKLREIASDAHTSESQVVKYFQSKAGVLDVLLIRARIRIQDAFTVVQREREDPVLVLRALPSLLLDLSGRDPDLFTVYLFNNRYYTLVPEEQYALEARIQEKLTDTFKEIKKSRRLKGRLKPEILASALWSLLLHMIRSKVYSNMHPGNPDFSRNDMDAVVDVFLDSCVI